QKARRFCRDGTRHRGRSNARSSTPAALLRGRRRRGTCFGDSRRLGLPLVEQYVHPHLSLVGKRLSSAGLNGILGRYFRRDTRSVSKTACGFSGSRLPVGPLHDRTVGTPLQTLERLSLNDSHRNRSEGQTLANGVSQTGKSLLVAFLFVLAGEIQGALCGGTGIRFTPCQQIRFAQPDSPQRLALINHNGALDGLLQKGNS